MAHVKKSPCGGGEYYSKTLMDAEKGIYVEEWSISSEELGIGECWSIDKRRLHGGISDGIDIITINNGKLSYTVTPTRGMGIWKGECQGVPIDWGSPIKEPVHPRHIHAEARGGLGWLDGFNEWVVRCGMGSFGAPSTDVIKDNMGEEKEVTLTLHGNVANIPASAVKVKIGLKPPFELGVEGVIHERTFFGSNLRLTTSMTTTLGGNALRISDTIKNLRSVPDEMEILYHCNYGVPFLEKGAHLVAPIKHVVPRNATAASGIDDFDVFGPPTAGFVEQVYFMELLAADDGQTKVMLANKDESKAVSVAFSLKELPFFTLWKNTVALEDGYVTGIEPSTSFPNPKRFEREKGRIVKLNPKEEYHAQVILAVHLSKDEVQKTSEEIAKVRGKTKLRVLKKPALDFSQV